MKHCGTQKIETERLMLRPFEAKDGHDMLELWIADPDVQREYGEPVYETMDAVQALLDKWIAGYEQPSFYRWAMVEKESARCIGQIAFCRVYEDCRAAEIEYCVSAQRWGRGYAGKALQAVLDQIFANTDFAWLEAYHREENKKSGRVLQKSSMTVTDNVERFRRAGEEPIGEVCYRAARRYYHASPMPGLTVLEPRVSNHGTPLVYASAKRENVLVYLSNAIEKHCKECGFFHDGPWQKWASYGFSKGKLVLEEYWPDATVQTYAGVGGYVYTVEGDFTPQKDIPDAYTSDKPVKVVDCEWVPDAYLALLQAENDEKMILKPYSENNQAMMDWLRDVIQKEYRQTEAPDYRRFLLDRFPDILQEN